ncbi:P-loop NTPase fold protein [Mycoplasma sp. ATU-Cv-703]|uniref:P-loop NTPase fold protein n=1 Tax=Mycoplasma sp. ATU-Cv-703 TaxID=2498595 RepID=UPI000FDE61AF
MKQINTVTKNTKDEILALDESTDLGNGTLIVEMAAEYVKRWLEDENGVNHLNINGRWGTGKTTIAHNVLNKFANDDAIECIHLNLWEYEFSSNPYFNVLTDMLAKMRIDGKYLKEQFKKMGWKIKAGVGIFGLDFWISLERDETQIQNKESLSEQIVKVINDAIVNSQKKYLILVDELDRCNPQKIVELLSLISRIMLKFKNCFIMSCTNNEAIKAIEQKMYPSGNRFCENYVDKIFSNVLNLDEHNEIKKIPTQLKQFQMRSEYIELTNNPLITNFINKTEELKGNYRFLKNASLRIKNLLEDEDPVLANYIFRTMIETAKTFLFLQFLLFYLIFVEKNDIAMFVEITKKSKFNLTDNFHKSALIKNISFTKSTDKNLFEEQRTPMGFGCDFIVLINGVAIHWTFFEAFLFDPSKTVKVKSLKKQIIHGGISGDLSNNKILLKAKSVHKNQILVDIFRKYYDESYLRLTEVWPHLLKRITKKF